MFLASLTVGVTSAADVNSAATSTMIFIVHTPFGATRTTEVESKLGVSPASHSGSYADAPVMSHSARQALAPNRRPSRVSMNAAR